ncbi:tight adherence pilus pseudopilin TadF [Aliivibrio fischeri]|uniref:tight adherence pilus pseudopilin TadF n=1 Tax=Aliivibrio fischeri TaxID=668 RepID=UPI00084CA6FC|nr:tight adherence pilus pseudopilin TadF [Aliivibrio fischeri]OED58177.1 ATP-binding protein [Aliivibrio fischeri]
MNLKFRVKGNFTVEFAVVGLGLSLIFIFSADVITRLSIKGKLDRLSYSLVNVLKERTQLYNDDYVLTKSDASMIHNIGENSLRRMQGSYNNNKFGSIIEELSFSSIGNPNSRKYYEFGGYACSLSKEIDDFESLSVVTTWTRQATLYRVTLCYNSDNMFGDVINKKYSDVNSSSLIIGR